MSVSLALSFINNVIGFSPLHGRDKVWKYTLKSTSSSLRNYFSFSFPNFKSCPMFLYWVLHSEEGVLKEWYRRWEQAFCNGCLPETSAVFQYSPFHPTEDSYPAMGTCKEGDREDYWSNVSVQSIALPPPPPLPTLPKPMAPGCFKSLSLALVLRHRRSTTLLFFFPWRCKYQVQPATNSPMCSKVIEGISQWNTFTQMLFEEH